MVDAPDAIFFAICGGIIGWIVFWAFILKVVRTAHPNAPPGSQAKKLIDNLALIQIAPLLPLVPIFVIWMLGVKRPLAKWRRHRAGKREVVKLRRRWEAVRREWARSDLECARSEKVPLTSEEEVSEDGIESSPPPPYVSKPLSGTTSHFESLPAELRMEIYSYLDYGMAIRLSLVNRFLQRDQPYESVDREQRTIYVYHADTFRHNQKAGRLACYTCLKLRSKGDFAEEFRSGELKRFGIKETERRCFDCQVVKGEISWGRVLGRKMDKWETKVWNRLVSLTRRKPPVEVQGEGSAAVT